MPRGRGRPGPGMPPPPPLPRPPPPPMRPPPRPSFLGLPPRGFVSSKPTVWRDELRGLVGGSDDAPDGTGVPAQPTDAEGAGAGESTSANPENNSDQLLAPPRLTVAELGAVIGDIAARGGSGNDNTSGNHDTGGRDEAGKDETETGQNGNGEGEGEGGGSKDGEIKHMSTALGLVAKGYMGLDVLNKEEEIPQFIGHLLDTIAYLENEVHFLRHHKNDPATNSDSDSDSDSDANDEAPDATPRMQLLHRVFCTNDTHHHSGTIYRDVPKFTHHNIHHMLLSGDELVKLPLFQARYPSVVFFVIKQHNCEVNDRILQFAGWADKSKSRAAELVDRIRIVSPLLQKALEKVAMFQLYDTEENLQVKEIEAPYPFLFHHRRQLEELSSSSEAYYTVLAPLKTFLDENIEAEYQEAEAMFARGMVNIRHLGKLFKQNHIVISMSSASGGGHIEAAVLKEITKRTMGDKLDMRGWSWRYNGTELQRHHWSKAIDLITDDETPINELPVHPIEFARPEHVEQLVRRGKTFWDMKTQVFKEYTGWDKNGTTHYVSFAARCHVGC